MPSGLLSPQYRLTEKQLQLARTPQLVGPPYEYKPTDEPAGYYQRDPVRYSGLVFNASYTGSGTVTTLIDTVAIDAGIFTHYDLAFALQGGSVTTPLRARIDIVRGGTTIFTTCVALSGTGKEASIAASPGIVLLRGDVINAVYVGTMTGVYVNVFAAVQLQPYR